MKTVFAFPEDYVDVKKMAKEIAAESKRKASEKIKTKELAELKRLQEKYDKQ